MNKLRLNQTAAHTAKQQRPADCALTGLWVVHEELVEELMLNGGLLRGSIGKQILVGYVVQTCTDKKHLELRHSKPAQTPTQP